MEDIRRRRKLRVAGRRRGAVYVATKAGSLVALRLADGSERGRAHVGDYVARTTPALSGNTFYVAAGYTLLAVDAETGLERWSVPLRFAGSCSPVVDGDLVYVATQEGHVSAFATKTGEEVWHYRNDNLLFGSPAVADGRGRHCGRSRRGDGHRCPVGTRAVAEIRREAKRSRLPR